MKITKVCIKNFKGIEGEVNLTLPRASILLAKNGTGKTSVLEAIRFALTGERPLGDAVNKNANLCSVSVELEEGESSLVIRRTLNRKGVSSCYINGEKTTIKNASSAIETFLHLPLDKVKIISSKEVISSLSSADFGSFLLSYVGKKTEKESLIKGVGGYSVLNTDLPSEVGIPDLDKEEESLIEERKALKREILSLESEISFLPDAPSEKRGDVVEALNKIKEETAAYRVYKSALLTYEKSKAAIASSEERKKTLEKELASLGTSITEPSQEKKEAISKEFTLEKKSYDNNKTAWTSQKAAKEALEKELAAISSPGVCPLSRHITCHEDMSSAREELKGAITGLINGMNALVEEMNTSVGKLKSLQDEATVWQKNKDLWDKQEAIKKEIAVILSAALALPEKPKEVLPPKAGEEERLNKLLSLIENGEKKAALSKNLPVKKDRLKDVEAAIKSISDKGEVRERVVTSFLSIFEDACNKKCVGTPFAFRFSYGKGVIPEMRNSYGTYLSAAELSGGEKAFFYYVIISLLNELTGAGILLLDELSVMDADTFGKFISLVKAGSEGSILLSAVDYKELVATVNDMGFPILSIEKSVSEGKSAVSTAAEDEDDSSSEDVPSVEDSSTEDSPSEADLPEADSSGNDVVVEDATSFNENDGLIFEDEDTDAYPVFM